MNVLLSEHQKMIKILNEYNVKYLLIGGYAVIMHGYPRTTGDMDLWLEPKNENKQKFCSALSKYGIEKEAIKELSKLNFEDKLVFTINANPQKIDFLTFVNIVDFNSAYAQKQQVKIDDVFIPLIHLNDLILTKINTGRLKDTADIEELQKVNK